jgi:hypothetical protein
MLVYQRVYVICIDAQSSSPCMAPDSEQALLAGRAIGVVPSAPSPIFLVNWVNPVRIKHSWYLLCENHLYQLYACSACVYIYIVTYIHTNMGNVQWNLPLPSWIQKSESHMTTSPRCAYLPIATKDLRPPTASKQYLASAGLDVQGKSPLWGAPYH